MLNSETKFFALEFRGKTYTFPIRPGENLQQAMKKETLKQQRKKDALLLKLNVAAQIKKIMRRKRISQKRLAAYLELPITEIRTLLRGLGDPDLRLLVKIATALGAELEVKLLPKADQQSDIQGELPYGESNNTNH